MEDLILNTRELEIVTKHKIELERKYNVEIFLPDVDYSSGSLTAVTELIFASISGDRTDIEQVKAFLSKEAKMKNWEKESNQVKDVPVITLSDDEDLPSSVTFKDDSICIIDPIMESKRHSVCFNNALDDSVYIIESSQKGHENFLYKNILKRENLKYERSSCEVSSTTDEPVFKKAKLNEDKQKESYLSPAPNFLPVFIPNEILKNKWKIKRYGKRKRYFNFSHIENTSVFPVVNFSYNKRKNKQKNKKKKLKPPENSVAIPMKDVINLDKSYVVKPLFNKRKNKQKNKKKKLNPSENSVAIPVKNVVILDKSDVEKPLAPRKLRPITIAGSNVIEPWKQCYMPQEAMETMLYAPENSVAIPVEDVVILDKSDVEKPLVPRKLRPIAIDGSNVARLHGTKTNTFSARGIKICIDYFLNRGHTEVTAFIPNFRRHSCKREGVRTTNPEIIEDLAKKQLIVFTPSRRIKNKLISSYDDRFIVQYAAEFGGIIVSNDNFRDLMQESESFKTTIENRLLQFLFVNDSFMVPNDPLGRQGPSLEEYLSFPPEDSSHT